MERIWRESVCLSKSERMQKIERMMTMDLCGFMFLVERKKKEKECSF